MTAEQLRKDTESRLESIFHIRVKLDDLAEHKRLCVIGESKFQIFVSNFTYLYVLTYLLYYSMYQINVGILVLNFRLFLRPHSLLDRLCNMYIDFLIMI